MANQPRCQQTNPYLLQSEIYQFGQDHEKSTQSIKTWKRDCFLPQFVEVILWEVIFSVNILFGGRLRFEEFFTKWNSTLACFFSEVEDFVENILFGGRLMFEWFLYKVRFYIHEFLLQSWIISCEYTFWQMADIWITFMNLPVLCWSDFSLFVNILFGGWLMLEMFADPSHTIVSEKSAPDNFGYWDTWKKQILTPSAGVH